MRIISDGTLGMARYTQAGGSTDDIKIMTYFDGSGSHYYMSCKNVGDVVYANIQGWVIFDGATDDIKWYNGVAYQDTGSNAIQDAWKSLEFQFNYGSDQYDIIYDGVNIDTADFRSTGATCKTFHCGLTGSGTGYWDTFEWPPVSGWEGKYLGITNPPHINGVSKEEVYKVNGVLSA